MQTQNRFFDDIAKLLGEGISAAIKCGENVKNCTKNNISPSESSATAADEKLDRIYEMVSKSRAENETLKEKIAQFEKELQQLKTKK